MKPGKLVCAILIFTNLLSGQGIAQHAGDGSLAQKIILVTDKTIYTNNEQVWFSAFLFTNNERVKDTATIFTLALYDPVADKVITSKKLAIENSFVRGNLFLPDSLNSDRYTLIEYTNLLYNGYPLSASFHFQAKVLRWRAR